MKRNNKDSVDPDLHCCDPVVAELFDPEVGSFYGTLRMCNFNKRTRQVNYTRVGKSVISGEPEHFGVYLTGVQVRLLFSYMTKPVIDKAIKLLVDCDLMSRKKISDDPNPDLTLWEFNVYNLTADDINARVVAKISAVSS